MAQKLKYLVIHCTDTPPTRRVTKSDIEQWHKGPLDQPDGTVIYLAQRYAKRSDLPDHIINGSKISTLKGRGWDRLGYSDMIHRNGQIENITPYNNDQFVDAGEITWGASGVNLKSRHIVLVGGWYGKERSFTRPFLDIFTAEQYSTLFKYLNEAVKKYPVIRIIGHRDVPGSGKTCPNFDVLNFCKVIGIPKDNYGL